MSKLHTMQAAIALSPTNKAATTLENGDFFAIQEIAHGKYRVWAVAPAGVPVWGWDLTEDEIDALPEKGVSPGAHVWMPMAAEAIADYRAIDTALQALAGQILNLRTELLVIKKMVAGKREKQEED